MEEKEKKEKQPTEDKRLNEPETQKQPADEEQKTGSNPAPSTTINVGTVVTFQVQ
ncbi:MAG: hypothetical protein QXV21_03385 [Candidatus Bathyarchaeia archaeon]